VSLEWSTKADDLSSCRLLSSTAIGETAKVLGVVDNAECGEATVVLVVVGDREEVERRRGRSDWYESNRAIPIPRVGNRRRGLAPLMWLPGLTGGLSTGDAGEVGEAVAPAAKEAGKEKDGVVTCGGDSTRSSSSKVVHKERQSSTVAFVW
jgi:hypothetical protein